MEEPLTNELNGRALVEKPIFLQLLKKFPDFHYGIWRYIFMRFLCWSYTKKLRWEPSYTCTSSDQLMKQDA
jgi:hypothetical protein